MRNQKAQLNQKENQSINKSKKDSRNLKGEVLFSDPEKMQEIVLNEEQKLLCHSDFKQNKNSVRLVLHSDQLSNSSSVKSQKYLARTSESIQLNTPNLSNSISYNSNKNIIDSSVQNYGNQLSVKDNIRHNTLMLAPILEESKIISNRSDDNISTNEVIFNKQRLRASVPIRSTTPHLAPSKLADLEGQIIQIKQNKSWIKDTSYLNTLRFVQSIQFSSASISVMKFNWDNRLLAAGGEDGVLRIWNVLDISEEDDPVSLIKNEPFREYATHNKEIIDISWNSLNSNILLTASKDKTVILWNTNDK